MGWLLQEDIAEFAKLQDDARINLETFEIEERTWQTQFDTNRSFGERSADVVARFGGSWRFIFLLISVLLIWIM